MVQNPPPPPGKKARPISESGQASVDDRAQRLFDAMITGDNETVDDIIKDVDPR